MPASSQHPETVECGSGPKSALLDNCLRRCAELGVTPTRHIFTVSIAGQSAELFEEITEGRARHSVRAEGSPEMSERRARRDAPYQLLKSFRCSTSKFGVGQQADSNFTPLGLHQILEKIGAGQTAGTVFKSREVIGHVSQPGLADAKITTRILWLDGLEPGFNRGGDVDSHARYIYIHGTGDETTIGRPASHGCVHLAAADLIPLFDLLPSGTLVWISP